MVSVSRAVVQERVRRAAGYSDAVGAHKNLLRIDPQTLLCDLKRCYANREDAIDYMDSTHLSYTGARRLLAYIAEQAAAHSLLRKGERLTLAD